MLFKLSVRNAKRSMRDYLVYMITMAGVAALMYAFNAMLFSDVVLSMWETATTMSAVMGLVTVFIIFIVAWLINYMVHFMLEKRSREFGTYLLLGMNKGQISKLYMRENMILGAASLLAGIIAGTVLQQIIMTIFYELLTRDYKIQIGGSPWCLLLTAGCYGLCYLLALRKNCKIFKKLTISNFMQMEIKGEAAETGNEKWKQWLFFFSCGYFILFDYMMFAGNYTELGVVISIGAFIIAIYLFYQGLSAFLVRYIRRGGRKIYNRDGLFLLRQLSSKMRTMRFTMGTLTLLFTSALLGCSVAMMFVSFQKESVYNAICFDIMVQSEAAEDTFETELALLAKEGVEEKQKRIYRIYQDGSHDMNDYLYTHLPMFGKKFLHEDGSLDEKAVEEDGYEYYTYDTYMSLSDYNYLRQMRGLEPVSLQENEYCIHLKERLKRDIETDFLTREIETANGEKLLFAGTYSEAFAQNGQNGADYVLVVPDEVCSKMEAYYSMMVMNIEGKPKEDLQKKLEEVYYQSRGRNVEEEEESDIIKPCGSDQVLTMGSVEVGVKDIFETEMLVIVSSVTFPLSYTSLIFVCVAMAILAVQQLSDSSRYRYRYDILQKLGVSRRELDGIICKQLTMYYLVPIAVSIILSAVIGIFAGERFVFYTGAANNSMSYFVISVLVFMGIYLLYFAATYLGFKRNVEQAYNRSE